jgi:hypothetical protein
MLGNGTRVPLDPRAPCYRVVATVQGAGTLIEREHLAYVSHFATCSAANTFSHGHKKPA